MKKIIYFCIGTALLAIGCTKNGAKETEHTEAITAEITAAQMEGRNAAREFVNRPWKDTMELQNQVLNALSRKAKYEAKGQKELAAAYDSAFMSTLRHVRPELYRSLDQSQIRK